MLILWVPFIVRFELSGGSGEDKVQRIELQWLFISRAVGGAATAERKIHKEEVTGREMDMYRALELIRTFNRPAIKLMRRVVRRIKIRELYCRLVFGFNDPADTGILAGFLYAASSILTQFSAASIRLYPVFQEQTFAYRTGGSFGITLGRMIVPVIMFVSDKSVRVVLIKHIRERIPTKLQARKPS